MEAILAIDGGGTRTRCVAIDRSGRTLAQFESGASNHLQSDEETVREELGCAIRKTLESANLRMEDVRCLSAGLAGVDYDGYGEEAMATLFDELGFTNYLIYGDMVIAHAGALALAPGIVVLAGTGSAILGIDTSGRRVKVGGWGPIYGDEGSALRISQRALTAAARAYDGRGPDTALLPEITKALGVSDFRNSISVIYGHRTHTVAALCPVVYQSMLSGDAVASALFEEAAEELMESVATAIRLMGMEHQPITVSYQGGVAENCPLLIEKIEQRLQQQFPLSRLQPPISRPVIGAYLLACRSLGWEPKIHNV